MKKAINQSSLTLILNCTAILMVLLSVFAFVLIFQSNNAVNSGNTDRYNLTYNANRFMDGSAHLTNEVRAYAATGDIVHYDNYWNEINELKNRDIGVETLRDIGITQQEDALIEEMSALSNKLVPLEEKAMKLTAEGKKEEALNAVYGQAYEQEISKIRALQTQFVSVLDIRSEQALQSQVDRVNQMTVLMFVCLVITAIIQVLSFVIIRLKVIAPILAIKDEMVQISHSNLSAEFRQEPDTSEIGTLIASIIETKTELKRYIGDVSDKLKAISDGDMTTTVDIDYLGEFSSIKISMLTILASFNEVLTEINNSSSQIAAGSRHMAEGAQSLSQSSIEQYSSVERLRNSISDISQKVENTTQAVVDAQSKAGQASDELTASNEKMQLMVQAMENISRTSEEIKKIVKTVGDIAFQTNILALNAAVEAARAGAAGNGFAVVAKEVRDLANKSSAAANSSTEFINQSVQAVANGTAAAKETAISLENATSLAGVIATTLDKISDDSLAQFREISSINQDVENITNIVQTNSATAEESAAASEELSGQSRLLKESISRFRLKTALDRNVQSSSSALEYGETQQSAVALSSGKH